MNIANLLRDLNIEYNAKNFNVKGINTLLEADSSEISFFENRKYQSDLKNTKAGAVFIREKDTHLLPDSVEAVVCKNPYLSMAYASRYFAKDLIRITSKREIAKSAIIQDGAYIGNGAKIGEDVLIFAGVYIGEDVTIKEGSIIHPNVTIYNDTIVGRNCILHAGVVLGSDGFGYAHSDCGEHIKIYHNGRVELEDFVEIGANSTVDRAVFGRTLIKSGVKIDNLVQIGHNVEIGSGSIIVAQAGVSGSTKIGNGVVMGGQSAVAGHIEIGDRAILAARSGVTKSIKGGETYSGFPLLKHKEWLKLQAKILKFFKDK